MAKKHLSAANLKSNLNKLSQYILTTWDALQWVDFYGKKHLNAAILKSNLSKLRYF